MFLKRRLVAAPLPLTQGALKQPNGGTRAPVTIDLVLTGGLAISGPDKGVITKGVFSLEKSLESLKSLNSLESPENGRNLLSFPQSGGSLETLESLNSLESLENGFL